MLCMFDDLFLFKQKTAYEMRISDWSSDVCSSDLWQEHCILTANEILGDKFVGTSNAFFAKKHGLESRGTNAHELPMVYAALAETDDDLRNSPYKVLKD